MNSLTRVVIIAVTLFCAALTGAEETTSPHPTYVICKNRKIVRTVRVEKAAGGSCKTIYTKAGVDRDIGSGRNSASCFKFMDNVQGNLESAGWKCKDISSSAISESGPAQ